MNNTEFKVKRSLLKFFAVIVVILLILFNPIIAKIFFNEGKSFNTNVFIILIGVNLILAVILGLYLVAIKHIEKRITNVFINTSLMFFIVVIVFLLFEFIIRLISPPEPVQLYAHNDFFNCTWLKPDLKLNLKTNEYDIFFQTNSIGLRDNDELVKKDSNEIRIMNLGDSFIQAAQLDIDNTMTYKLERLLDSLIQNKKINVYNVGTSGCGPEYQKKFLEQNIKKFELDYLFYFPYIGNDIITLSKLKKNYGTKMESLFNSLMSMPRQYSKLIDFVCLRLPGFAEAEMRGPMGRPTQPFDGLPETESANILLKTGNTYKKNAYNELWIQLDDIIEICNKNNVDLFVFIIPTKEQVDEEMLYETLSFYKLKRESIELYKPQSLIGNFLKERNIKYYDLSDTLINANVAQKTYFDFDSHWNKYGNDVVSKYIFNNTKSSIVKN